MNEQIPSSELEIMRILWQSTEPLSFAQIRTTLEVTTGWKKSTIQTLLTRLHKKGIISAQTSHVTLYTPNITEIEYLNNQKQNFINKLFDGSAKNLVASLLSDGQLSQSDVVELQQYFKMEGDTK
ncbi:MAG: BlaI/MecI/CopY family transcriptional regulator [Defluviitaleaceae bacterium]|nr:BlaI/MecI/CopY family transcriptional regulator [Defluviitaleaceae bacterium]